MSSTSTSFDFLLVATRDAVIINYIEYLKVVSTPIFVNSSLASSVISTSSSSHLCLYLSSYLISRMLLISSSPYGIVYMIKHLSSKSIGNPCGLINSKTMIPFMHCSSNICNSPVCGQNNNRCSYGF